MNYQLELLTVSIHSEVRFVKINPLLKSSEMIPNVQIPYGKSEVAANTALLTKQTFQQLSMGVLGIPNLFLTNWDCPYMEWPWGIPIAHWAICHRANHQKRI